MAMNEMNQPTKGTPTPPPGGRGGDSPTLDAATLAAVLDEYLAGLQAGQKPDRAALLARYPDLAGQLEAALDGIEFIHGATGAPETPPAQLGDFRIRREIGRGGMGVVYEAEQISLSRRVALKVLRFGASVDEVTMQRFQREAATVAQLHHTNIVPIFAVGVDEGMHFYAMQFIDGANLSAVAESRRQAGHAVSAEDAAAWGLQAAEALAHAHRHGIIHRDIKPSNLLLDPSGRLWLTDFGLARRVDDVTLSVAGVLLGTPRYMSPEQAGAAAQPVDHRTDIYSLGATLYELVTGRPIFEAATPFEVIHQILNAEPRQPRHWAPRVPRDFETIILKCLEKEPPRRYASAQALADDLRAFLEGRPISVRPPGLVERAVRWEQRHRRTTSVAAASAGVSLALLLGGWVGWQAYRQARNGGLSLTTEGPRLTAEFVPVEHPETTAVVVPVPAAEPVVVPEGEYEIRLSTSGLPSESWPVTIERGPAREQPVELPADWLFPPIELSAARPAEWRVVRLNAQPDLLLLTHRASDPGVGELPTRIERLDGRTGRPVWPRALVLDATTLPADRDLSEWRRLLDPSGLTWRSGGEARFAEVVADLDGDNVDDLVWVSRNTPSLLAVSGADGRVLWWCRSGGRPPPTTAATAAHPRRFGGSGAVVGRTGIADADGDGRPDLVAGFVSEGDRFVDPSGDGLTTGPQCWVAAVAGHDGHELWRRDLPPVWRDYPRHSDAFREYQRTVAPVNVSVAGRPAVALAAGDRLYWLDPRTGEDVAEPLELGFTPLFAPAVMGAPGSDEGMLLLLRGDPGPPVRVEFLAVSLADGAVRWREFVSPGNPQRAHELAQLEEPFHLLADLDHDGWAEVVHPAREPLENGRTAEWSCVEIRAGVSGRVLARTRLGPVMPAGESGLVDRMIAGPDLDGDGWDELFLAWRERDPVEGRMRTVLTAVSGRDGRRVWERRQDFAGPCGPLQWHRAGRDGWPELVVPVRQGPGGQRLTRFLSAADGTGSGLLPDVDALTIADLDADGIQDLLYAVRPQGAPRLLAVQGRPPAAWKRTGIWEAAGDLDGDGADDLVRAFDRHLEARSGRDGRRLWRTAADVLNATYGGRLVQVAGDLDDDQRPDLLALVRAVEEREAAWGDRRTVAAFSGATGARLWEAPELDVQGGGSFAAVNWRLDHPFFVPVRASEAGPGLVAVVHGPNDGGDALALSLLDGATGARLWGTAIMPGTLGLSPPHRARNVGDWNGDGGPDLALWTAADLGDEAGPGFRLQVFDGRTGTALWREPSLTRPGRLDLLWPEPLAVDLDADGRPEVVTLRHESYRQEAGGYRCELEVADGAEGHLRWRWSWVAAFPEVWPPLALDGTEASGPVLVLGVRERNFTGLVGLDRDGRELSRLPLDLAPADFGRAGQVWRALRVPDEAPGVVCLTGDGLAFVRRPDLQPQWVWHAPDSRLAVVGVEPGADERPPSLVAWSGRSVFGLRLDEGRPVWRTLVPEAPPPELARGPVIGWLSNRRAAALPAVFLEWRDHTAYQWRTLARQSWPVTASGRCRPPAPEPLNFEFLATTDMLPSRALPWSRERHFALAPLAGWRTLLAVVAPVLLALQAVRRRHWGWNLVLGVWCGITAWRLEQALSVVVAVAAAPWLWRSRAGETRGKRSVLALLPAALAVPPLALLVLSHPLGNIHPWGGGWWLDELLGEALVLCLVGAPPIAAYAALLGALRRGRWKRLAALLVGILVAALVVAWMLLEVDRAASPSPYPYSLRGWYWVLVPGLWVTGLAVGLIAGWRALIQAMRRRRQSVAPPQNDTLVAR